MKTAPFYAAAFMALMLSGASADDLDKKIPAPTFDPADTAASETAVLAGGCFWGQQGVFETTGHAESVQITFDPKVISYGKILQIYFSVAHDPTQLNRQGPDEGSSYRSQIFYASPQQQKTAEAYIAQLTAAHIYGAPIVTKVGQLSGFYRAESYHQDFLIHNPTYPYIVYNDLPKIAALKKVWPEYYQEKPVQLASL